MINLEDFKKIEIRVGKVVEVYELEDAKYSTHKLVIDFGNEIGRKKSCARVNKYSKNELIGKLVVAVLNFPPKQVGKNLSEVLTLGVPDEDGDCVLVSPDKIVPLGGNLY